jgi:hypothetical protein
VQSHLFFLSWSSEFGLEVRTRPVCLKHEFWLGWRYDPFLLYLLESIVSDQSEVCDCTGFLGHIWRWELCYGTLCLIVKPITSCALSKLYIMWIVKFWNIQFPKFKHWYQFKNLIMTSLEVILMVALRLLGLLTQCYGFYFFFF